MKYDFTKNASNLIHWEAKKHLLNADKNSNKSNFLNNLILFSKQNPYSFYSPILVVIVTTIIHLASNIPLQEINKLKPSHEVYAKNINIIRRISKNITKIRNDLSVHKNYFHNAAPLYLFAYELQNIVPKDLQLSSYLIDKSSFKINARSYNLDPINKFISLMSTSSIIDFPTISLKKLSRSRESSISEGSELSKDSMILVEISGLLKEISIKKKLKLYNQTSSDGMSKKLQRVIQLDDTLEKEGGK